ncbi:MAG TPA: SDR family NAD(P)-dependent oxidoreductase [Hyphomicrobiaceae bacterium]|nr:SDR family NAD(P)-dependent oxidoreductase [Hyphomicrobiaceae bacterium]
MEGLAGRRALITGGGAGIGRAIALKLAREGCDIAILDIDAAAAEATAGEVRAIGRSAQAAMGNVGDAASVRGGIASLAEAGAPFDILVNNAGVARLGSLLTISQEDWRDTFAVNVDGVFNVTRAVVPGMVERRHGAVVNLASWLGRRGHPAFSAYAATKFAVVGMTQSLAPEVAPHGVRVNAVCPGLIGGTPMRDALDAVSEAAGLPRAAERAKTIPLGRIGTPEDVAKVVAFLASDEAAYVTGACYDVTGGMWMT